MILRYQINNKTRQIKIWQGDSYGNFTDMITCPYSARLHESLIAKTPVVRSKLINDTLVVENEVIFLKR